MSSLVDTLILILAILGGLVVAALIVVAVAWATIRGIRVPPLTRGEDENDLTWT